MSCSACSCGKSCSCCPKFREENDPLQRQDYLLAATLLLLPLSLTLGMLRRSKIILTDSGLTLPDKVLPAGSSALQLAPISKCCGQFSKQKSWLTRPWSDISSITLLEARDGEPEDRLREGTLNLTFQPGGMSTLKLSLMTEPDLEVLFNGLKRWADQSVLSADLLDAISKILAQANLKPAVTSGLAAGDGNEVEDLSFTSMWKNDLHSHMGATVFVPLKKGAVLKSGRFTVIALLASGGLSAVYLAETSSKSMVILKESVVPKNIDEKTRAKARELFEREAALLLKLKHPQIARVVDHLVEGGRDYLVLEYLPGQSLRQLVKRTGPQTEARVVKWTAEIASILEYLHGLNPPIVHRDLTPDNVVLKEDGTIALIDFGAANEYLGAATGTLIGKQSYISPEQFRGKASPASDIYALGCSMHFLLTGQDPDALSVSHPRAQRPDISEALDSFVASCTALDESTRLSSAQALKSALSEIATGSDGTTSNAEPAMS